MNQFKALPYKYDALEPFIDAETMRVHHDLHYKTYFEKFNAALEKYPALQKKDVQEILADLKKVPAEIKTAVINHGGGYYHHDLLWPLLKKDVPFKGEIAAAIIKKWGSYDAFKAEMSQKALAVFGSGWTWLVWNGKELELMNTANQESPVSVGKVILLVLDVWEHAYYLKYQNRRAEYVENFFKVVNWEKINERYLREKK